MVNQSSGLICSRLELFTERPTALLASGNYNHQSASQKIKRFEKQREYDIMYTYRCIYIYINVCRKTISYRHQSTTETPGQTRPHTHTHTCTSTKRQHAWVMIITKIGCPLFGSNLNLGDPRTNPTAQAKVLYSDVRDLNWQIFQVI